MSEFSVLLLFYFLLSRECASSYRLETWLKFPDLGGKVRGKGET